MFENISLWYSNLPLIQQIFWGCAIVATVIFLIQFLLTFIGLDGTDGGDLDFAGDASLDGDTLDTGGAMSLFSIRSIVNFFVGFGWGGVCFADLIESTTLLMLVSILVGLAFASLFFFIWRQARKFEANGTMRIADCEGRTARVYLRIPAKGEGMGKVQISVGGSIHELDAQSTGEAIPTGTNVRVTGIITDTQTLIVECL